MKRYLQSAAIYLSGDDSVGACLNSASNDRLERMRAIVAQAVAEAENRGNGQPIRIHLDVYGDCDEAQILTWFREASAGTPVESAEVVITTVGSRYICWTCCGLRFESADGVCPNCGEEALVIPEEIAFALRRAEA
jgi:Zn finger protein HypA/HybF involved in hydrogenase expression